MPLFTYWWHAVRMAERSKALRSGRSLLWRRGFESYFWHYVWISFIVIITYESSNHDGVLCLLIWRVSNKMSGWPSGLRRCVQVAVSSGGVGSNPTSDWSFWSRWLSVQTLEYGEHLEKVRRLKLKVTGYVGVVEMCNESCVFLSQSHYGHLNIQEQFNHDGVMLFLIRIVCTKSSGWPSGLRRCVQVAVSSGGVGSNPSSDIVFGSRWLLLSVQTL